MAVYAAGRCCSCFIDDRRGTRSAHGDRHQSVLIAERKASISPLADRAPAITPTTTAGPSSRPGPWPLAPGPWPTSSQAQASSVHASSPARWPRGHGSAPLSCKVGGTRPGTARHLPTGPGLPPADPTIRMRRRVLDGHAAPGHGRTLHRCCTRAACRRVRAVSATRRHVGTIVSSPMSGCATRERRRSSRSAPGGRPRLKRNKKRGCGKRDQRGPPDRARRALGLEDTERFARTPSVGRAVARSSRRTERERWARVATSRLRAGRAARDRPGSWLAARLSTEA